MLEPNLFDMPVPVTQLCRKCGERKPLASFPVRRDGRPRSRYECKACHAAYMRKWKERPENKEYNRRRAKEWQAKHPTYSRATNLRLKYGITIAEYDAIRSGQGGVCAICGGIDKDIDRRTGKNRALAVDHDHATKKVRGLLCGDCNRSLGLVKESRETLERMIAYLAQHSA